MTPHIPQIADILAALVRNERRIVVSGLNGSAPAYLIAELLRVSRQNLLIITADQEKADEFCRELAFFGDSGDSAPLSFPAWDSHPFAAASPHPDISGARLNTLFRLLNGLARAVVMPAAAAMQRVMPAATFSEASCYLVTGEEFERDDLLARLVTPPRACVPLTPLPSVRSTRWRSWCSSPRGRCC
jgi:transcription-repair coupling factor (superfamily II helicase)